MESMLILAFWFFLFLSNATVLHVRLAHCY
jgi:hypothetical protein